MIDDGVDNSLVLFLDCSASYHVSFFRETVVVLVIRADCFAYGKFSPPFNHAHVRGQALTQLLENN